MRDRDVCVYVCMRDRDRGREKQCVGASVSKRVRDKETMCI